MRQRIRLPHFALADNVHLFLDDWDSVRLDELGVTVHGCGFQEPDVSVQSSGITWPAEKRGHAARGAVARQYVSSAASSSAYLPVSQADLETSQADYVSGTITPKFCGRSMTKCGRPIAVLWSRFGFPRKAPTDISW